MTTKETTPVHLAKNNLGFSREPLLAPFGFKGGSLDELWLVNSQIEDTMGHSGYGMAIQSVLWSDPQVFTSFSQCGGNAAMLLVTQKALSLIKEIPFTTPPRMIESILPALYAYASALTGIPDLKKTFVLNALVSVDFALWQLYAQQHQIHHFDELVQDFSSDLTARHSHLGVIPLVTYGMSLEEVHSLAKDGVFFFKIKLGQDPGQRHSQQEMLEADKQRALDVHLALKDYTTPFTDSGHIMYYFDANGRYEKKEFMEDLLSFMDVQGILARTLILEEPFPEGIDMSVINLPVRIAADESAHSPEDVRHLIDDLGYSALALKPIAKTLSLSLTMLEIAMSRDTPCFCADLTVTPYLCDWNRNVACRLPPLPGLKTGIMESNGRQNYRNWEALKAAHPLPDAPWLEPQNGLYLLDETFYRTSGGVLLKPQTARQS